MQQTAQLCVPLACPFLQQTRFCTSPLALSRMPALLWMLSTSPAYSRAEDAKTSQEQPHHCPVEGTRTTVSCSTQGIHFPLILLCKTEIKKGKSFPAASMASAGARPAGLAAVPGQPCSCPYPVHCQILQLVSCCALLTGSQIAFQYHGPLKCFSKAKILLFCGLKPGLLTPAGAGLWPEVWLQGKWVRKALFIDTSQSWELPDR